MEFVGQAIRGWSPAYVVVSTYIREEFQVSNRAKWVVDKSHSLVEFSIKHMMFATVKGQFTEFEGVIEGDPADLTTATFSATIKTASINTRDQQRDDHLRSADFFDAENHPEITYVSRQVTKTGENSYKILGDLTIRGVTQPVELTAEMTGTGKDPWGGTRMGVSAEGKISRKDFGLTWNAMLETGGILVGDEVRLHIEVEAVKQE